jgi:hypothetical protein
MQTPAEKQSGQRLEVRVKIDQFGEGSFLDAAVYVFDEAERLLAFEPLARQESTQLSVIKLPPNEYKLQHLRVIVAPAILENLTATTRLDKAGLPLPSAQYKTLKRRGGVELKIKRGIKPGFVEIAVSQADWKKWLQCSCRVHGRLVKYIKIPDGSMKAWGISHA